MNHKKTLTTLILALCILLALGACGAAQDKEGNEYMKITPEEAKQIIDSETEHTILDVRTDEEYAEGHIPGAILIPDYEIEQKAPEILTDKDRTILVYCRSGNRSKAASEKLVQLGYTDVREFGGIIDWPYEVEERR